MSHPLHRSKFLSRPRIVVPWSWHHFGFELIRLDVNMDAKRGAERRMRLESIERVVFACSHVIKFPPSATPKCCAGYLLVELIERSCNSCYALVVILSRSFPAPVRLLEFMKALGARAERNFLSPVARTRDFNVDLVLSWPGTRCVVSPPPFDVVRGHNGLAESAGGTEVKILPGLDSQKSAHGIVGSRTWRGSTTRTCKSLGFAHHTSVALD
mmetsp:Transcript_21202/g.47803  ORF Transcript_21202/g.47803 Transcript_21202/m.47803 type:complete len:213 (+) Transcript_21202:418-1056(+)